MIITSRDNLVPLQPVKLPLQCVYPIESSVLNSASLAPRWSCEFLCRIWAWVLCICLGTGFKMCGFSGPFLLYTKGMHRAPKPSRVSMNTESLPEDGCPGKPALISCTVEINFYCGLPLQSQGCYSSWHASKLIDFFKWSCLANLYFLISDIETVKSISEYFWESEQGHMCQAVQLLQCNECSGKNGLQSHSCPRHTPPMWF